jgi:hypothetical protein
MKAPHFLVVGTAAAVIFAASAAEAQYLGGVPPRSFPGHGGMHGTHGFFYPFVFVEQQPPVIIEREVVRKEPVVVEPPPPPPPPRKPYKIGASYSTLPSGCMKLIEEGVSYYLCSGEWYRQVGSGSGVTYKAVAKR